MVDRCIYSPACKGEPVVSSWIDSPSGWFANVPLPVCTRHALRQLSTLPMSILEPVRRQSW